MANNPYDVDIRGGGYYGTGGVTRTKPKSKKSNQYDVSVSVGDAPGKDYSKPQKVSYEDQAKKAAETQRKAQEEAQKHESLFNKAKRLVKDTAVSAGKTAAKSANTVHAAQQGLMGAEVATVQAVTGHKDAAKKTVAKTNKTVNETLDKGIKGQGSFLTSKQAASGGDGIKGFKENYVKPTTKAAAEVAQYAPVGKFTKGATLLANATRGFVENAAVGGATDVMAQAAEKGKNIDYNQTKKAAAISGIFGAGGNVIEHGVRAGNASLLERARNKNKPSPQSEVITPTGQPKPGDVIAPQTAVSPPKTAPAPNTIPQAILDEHQARKGTTAQQQGQLPVDDPNAVSAPQAKPPEQLPAAVQQPQPLPKPESSQEVSPVASEPIVAPEAKVPTLKAYGRDIEMTEQNGYKAIDTPDGSKIYQKVGKTGNNAKGTVLSNNWYDAEGNKLTQAQADAKIGGHLADAPAPLPSPAPEKPPVSGTTGTVAGEGSATTPKTLVTEKPNPSPTGQYEVGHPIPGYGKLVEVGEKGSDLEYRVKGVNKDGLESGGWYSAKQFEHLLAKHSAEVLTVTPEAKAHAVGLKSMDEGLTGGKMQSDNEGGYIRTSEHSPFYRKVFAEKGRAPNKADYEAEAQRQIDKGEVDTSAPKNPEDVGISRVAASIHQKAVERGLMLDPKDLAEYDKIKFADQAAKAVEASNLPREQIDDILSGKADLPQGLKPTAFVLAIEEHPVLGNDPDMILKLAGSKLARATSEAGQELGLARQRNPNSSVEAIEWINAIRKEAFESKYGKTADKAIKQEVEAIAKADVPIDLSIIDDFFNVIKC
jgi:hypothetical protein